MGLESRITGDLKEAMKAKDQAALRTIRAIKAAILLQKTDGSGKELTEEMEIKMIQKLAKQRQDSLDIYVKQTVHLNYLINFSINFALENVYEISF